MEQGILDNREELIPHQHLFGEGQRSTEAPKYFSDNHIRAEKRKRDLRKEYE